MKKTFLIAVILLFTLLTGCAHNSGVPAKSPSPVSDFQYETNEEGGITITKYLGTDQDVIIPAKIKDKAVTQIGQQAFSHNETIESVEIPDSVTLIADLAFDNCTFLASVSLSQNLKSMGLGVFTDCVRLSAVTLPNTLTYVPCQTFKNCTLLRHISIPENITEIHENAFFNSGIETIDFKEGITVIGCGAFAYTMIKTVVLPQSVRKIERVAFGNCTQLESVVLNNGLIAIDSQAFGGQSKLTEIVIPASVTDIDEMFCDYNNSLRAVKFEGNAPQNYRTETTKSFVNPLKEYGYMSYTVYYHKGAAGFTSPEWCGYPTKVW